MRWVARTAFVALVALVACKDARAPRGNKVQRRDAAGSTASSAQRLLRYQPANLQRYQLAATVTTPPGAFVPLDIARTIAVELVADDDRHVRARISDGDPLAAYDLGDASNAAVLLFPELPRESVARGQEWTVPLGTRVPGREQPVDITHAVQYTRDAVCPSGFGTCAQLVLDAPARNAAVRVSDATWLIVYSFAGTIELDVARGVVARARLDITANVANGPANVTVNATVIATPRTSNGEARD